MSLFDVQAVDFRTNSAKFVTVQNVVPASSVWQVNLVGFIGFASAALAEMIWPKWQSARNWHSATGLGATSGFCGADGVGRAMGRFIILVVVLAVLWLLLSGYYDKPLLLAFGVFSVLLAAWLAKRAHVLDSEGVPGGVFPGILGYWLWLTVEIGKSNLIVARHALAVEPKLSPKLFIVPNPPRSNLGKVIFANSITLTPGTVSVDLREDSILVHGLTEELSDAQAIAEMGERVAKTERAQS